MNKELTPLEALEVIKHTTDLYMPNELNGYKRELDIIENALKEYDEGLENAKTYVRRTAQDALFNLEVLAMKNTSRSFWKLPQQLADDVKKELKALEIIKEKEVNIGLLKWSKNLTEYNTYDPFRQQLELTQEEYDLLKEVLL